MNWKAVSEQIELAAGQPFNVESVHPLAGGDINSAFWLQACDQSYFVKLNRADLAAMFEAEFVGLQELEKTQTIRVPSPVACGQTGEHSFLVLEHVEFGCSNKLSDHLLGQQLAQMHQRRQPYFGWHRDNTIGSTLQINHKNNDWLTFWREQRLGMQLQLAAENGYSGRLQTSGERLCHEMAALFDDYLPQSSLLHGDLWSGNAAVDKQGRPVIFDPACYYGDREADLAMTELFGGFSRDFYAAYHSVWPLDKGYAIRKNFYNLYHILNHLNLFGGGYLRQAENMMTMLLAEIN
ncbi:MAG: fructosamine kinase family protein [Methylococcales bacterium]|nr:fructosamine kinase family protein [Methylococcales bacterium]